MGSEDIDNGSWLKKDKIKEDPLTKHQTNIQDLPIKSPCQRQQNCIETTIAIVRTSC